MLLDILEESPGGGLQSLEPRNCTAVAEALRVRLSLQVGGYARSAAAAPDCVAIRCHLLSAELLNQVLCSVSQTDQIRMLANTLSRSIPGIQLDEGARQGNRTGNLEDNSGGPGGNRRCPLGSPVVL